MMKVLRYLLMTVTLAVLAYVLFALVVSTDVEKKLKAENDYYESVYPELEPGAELLEDAIAHLQMKDNAIYRDIFNTDSPDADPVSTLDLFFGSDTIPDTKIVGYTAAKSDALVSDADVIEKNFEKIFRTLASAERVLPPMTIPVRDISYPQIGASRGMKLNPFLKATVQHNGVDIIALQGSPVYASADGTVKSVTRSGKGAGNVVEISHAGGYVTRYAHLSEISVSQGQSVSKGRKIGTVGMSGSAFAPHLHYEVLKDSLALDPVNHMFASVGPEDYSNMLFMAVNTEQSMD